MKKLAVLALHMGFGGVEKSIANLCDMLCDDFEITVLCAYKLNGSPAFNVNKKVKIEYLTGVLPNKEQLRSAFKSLNPVKIVRESVKSARVLYLRKQAMKKALKSLDADVIISTRILYNGILGRHGAKNAVKLAQEHRHHGNDEKYIKKLVRSLKNIDYFLPVSQYLTDFYAERLNGKKTKCVYIPHALESVPEVLSPLTGNEIISVGRLSPEKGFSDLIDVFDVAQREQPGLRLNIVGDGELRGELQAKIDGMGLGEKITLHGFKDNSFIDSMMADCFAYVMPSFEESFGLVLIEAMAHGVPCIAFDSALGPREIIIDGENGFLIKNRDKEEMRGRIMYLYENRDALKKMGMKARETTLGYSKDKVKEKWLEFLR